jgi:hypothetical protein
MDLLQNNRFVMPIEVVSVVAGDYAVMMWGFPEIKAKWPLSCPNHDLMSP